MYCKIFFNENQKIMAQEKYKVCVRCFTYNQAHYIEDTLNGFCMQETSFPYVAVIMDDASSDGEQGVIRDYFDRNFCHSDDKYSRQEETEDYVLTFARHKTNRNCFFAVFYLKYNHWGKKKKGPYAAEWFDNTDYIAICEGDDFWTDSCKLQKEADVLDANPDVSMVYTAFNTIGANGEVINRPKYNRFIKRSYTGNILPELFYSNFILTLTIMLRRDVLYSDLYLNSPNKYDYTTFFSAAFLGRCYFLPDITGCYRKNEGSCITAHFDEVEQGLFKVYLYFVDIFLIGVNAIQFSFHDTISIYRNILVNLFFHDNYQYIKRVIGKNVLSCLLIPEAYVFSLLKKLKRKTYGSIDR